MRRTISPQWCNGLLSCALEISTDGTGNVIWRCYFSTRVNQCSYSPLCLGAANPLMCHYHVFDYGSIFDLWVHECYLPTLRSAFVPSITSDLFFSVVPGIERLDLIFCRQFPHPIKKRTKFTFLLANCVFFSFCPFESWKMLVACHYSFSFSNLWAVPVSQAIRLTQHTNAHFVMLKWTRTRAV